MRIAHLGLRGVPAQYSGIEKAVEELGTRLVLKGHEVLVYCMAGRQAERPKLHKGMKLKYIPTIKKKNSEMIIYTLISSVLASSIDYDIIHYHALGPSTLSFIPRIMDKRIIVTVHGLDWMRDKWGFFAKKYLRLGEWTSSHFAHRTIVVSKTLKQYYCNKYKNSVVYIPNGVQNATILPLGEIGKELHIEKHNYLLYVGRLTREKNIHLLIQAFKQLKTDMKLLIVGGSSHTLDYIEELKELSNPCDRVIFTGPIYDNNILARIYSNAYMFILPVNAK